MKKIIIASNNPGKLREVSATLADLPIQLIPQSDYAVTDIEETGLTFVENAIIKARHAAAITGLPALADDSGLAVDALNGAPGIYSARYAGNNATDTDRINKLLTELKDVPKEQRSARFVCCLALLQSPQDPLPLIIQGIWQGSIGYQPKGDNGFGYDPIFIVNDKHCSAAELDSKQKNHISHRGQALQQLSVELVKQMI